MKTKIIPPIVDEPLALETPKRDEIEAPPVDPRDHPADELFDALMERLLKSSPGTWRTLAK